MTTRITNAEDLKAFLRANFSKLSNEDYIEIMANTLGIYENTKPNDLDKLLSRIDTHAAYLATQPVSHEMPLFWIVE
jgi:hypothetical protein